MNKKMKQLKQRAKDILTRKSGMTMVEIVVLISVILVIATALFLMRNTITGFIQNATDQVNTLDGGGTIGSSSGNHSTTGVNGGLNINKK